MKYIDKLTIDIEKYIVHKRYNKETLQNTLQRILKYSLPNLHTMDLDKLFKLELASEHGASDYECLVDLEPLGTPMVLTIYYLKVPYAERDDMFITEICIEEI